MCCNNRLRAWHQESSLELTYLGHLSSPPTTWTTSRWRYGSPNLVTKWDAGKTVASAELKTREGRLVVTMAASMLAMTVEAAGWEIFLININLLTLSLANEQVEWVGNPRAGPSKGYCTSQGRSVATFWLIVHQISFLNRHRYVWQIPGLSKI